MVSLCIQKILPREMLNFAIVFNENIFVHNLKLSTDRSWMNIHWTQLSAQRSVWYSDVMNLNTSFDNFVVHTNFCENCGINRTVFYTPKAWDFVDEQKSSFIFWLFQHRWWKKSHHFLAAFRIEVIKIGQKHILLGVQGYFLGQR